MTPPTPRLRRRPLRALLTLALALLALGLLWPPGPYRTFAQGEAPAELSATYHAYLPLLANGAAPAPDLRFQPDAIELAPGGVAQVTVRVDPQADLRGASFALPQAQDGIVSDFAAAPDGLTGTLTITASAALEADERMLNVRGRSGVDSSKTWVGALKIATTSTTTAKTVYVDAVKGKDTNSGAQSAPLKTLRQALTKVVAGDTVKLLPGNYDKTHSGDTYPLTVPHGVTVVGTLASTGAKQTFLSASSSAAGETGLRFAGDATVKNLELDVFGRAIEADTGRLTLSNLNFFSNRTTVSLAGTAQATVNKPYLFINDSLTAIDLRSTAKLTIDGGEFEYVGDCGGSNALTASGNTTFVVKNTRFEKFPSTFLLMGGQAAGELSSSSLVPSSLHCGNDSLIEIVGEARLKLNGFLAPGTPGLSPQLIRLDNAGTLEADALNVSNYNNGIVAGGLSNVTLTNSFLSNNTTGILGGSGARINVSKTTFFNNIRGLDAFAVKLRNSTVRGGDIGVFAQSELVNLGDFTTGGNNMFADSVTTSVYFTPVAPDRELLAIGNTWNSGVQLAGSDGRYPLAVTEIKAGDSKSKGLNFWLDQPDGIGFPIKIRVNF